MNGIRYVLAYVASVFLSTQAIAASLEKAEMLYRHGLTDDAKRELIEVIYDPDIADRDKSAAYYLLGSIAFEENRIDVAIQTWEELVSEIPTSEEAKVVQERIGELAGVVNESVRESVDNAVALAYLQHGDFWSRGKDTAFIIDASWIPNVDTAVKWYDKVIKEFPNTVAARIAYEEKMRSIIGWKDPGQYGSKHGLSEDFEQYMPQLLNTFWSYEKSFPGSPRLQAFRYQIAQAYWKQRQWDNTREWLRIVIAADAGDTFYKDLAERRLLKVEY